MMKYRQESNPQRHKCISPTCDSKALRKEAVIEELPELKKYLHEAIAVEHFTIPPYLCALYSIQEGANPEAARIIRTVAVEEMLHMIMAANILNAVGGEPNIRASLPKYPDPLPHSAIGFPVSLMRFSKQAVNTFLRIERPAECHEYPPGYRGKFLSIGEFYEAVREAMVRLDAEAKRKGEPRGIFTGTQKQITPEHYYGGGGKLIPVFCIHDANRAIDEIVGQGEGINGSIFIDYDDDGGISDDVELAHYFRFNEIFWERRYQSGDKAHAPPSGASLAVDWNAVHNMKPNPKMADFDGDPGLLKKGEAFNRTYMKLLDCIQGACSGNPEVLKEDGVPLMFALKTLAVELMQVPMGDGNYTAGPTFEAP